MTEQREITRDEAVAILHSEEGHYLDLKSADLKPNKMSETVSAFANASGGEIYLGISEQTQNDGTKIRHWTGFSDMEAANGHFQVLEGLSGLGNHFTASFLSCPGMQGQVLHLTIPKSKDIINASDGRPRIRRNAQNLRVDSVDDLHRLRLDKGVITFEDDTLPIPVKHVANSFTMIEFALEVIPSTEPEEWLESQFLIVGDKPTVASALLFMDEPQAALPKRSAIKIFRYRSKADEGSRDTLAFDPITIEGCAYHQISRAVEKTKELIEDIKKLGTSGLENIKYPEETLHEIVTNAVLHRDYSIQADTQIRIYDNRIEVESPGRLPGHVTPHNFLQAQSARNPKLVRLINKFPNPPNKDVGEGLNTAFEAMKKLRLKAPILKELENSVTVYIAHAPLSSPEDTVMEFLRSNDEITNSKGRELTGIGSENSMKEVFYRLQNSSLIERVPDKKGNASAWRKYTGG